jgi:hypothetical protein
MGNENMEKQQKPSLFGMIWSPGEQFERIRQNPRIWGPLSILTLIYVVAFAITALTIKAADLVVPGVTTIEDAEMILGFTKVTSIVMGFITPAFTALISTVIFLVIVKIAGKDTTFKQLFSMSTYVLIISAIGLLLNNSIHAMIGGNPTVLFTSLAGLLNSDSALLMGIELFSIWEYILIAIGLHKVGQLSKGVSITIMVLYFLATLGISYVSTLISGVAGV